MRNILKSEITVKIFFGVPYSETGFTHSDRYLLYKMINAILKILRLNIFYFFNKCTLTGSSGEPERPEKNNGRK